MTRRVEKRDREAAVEAAILEHAIEAKNLRILQKRLDRVRGVTPEVDGIALRVSVREGAPAPWSVLVVLPVLGLFCTQSFGDVPLLLFVFVEVGIVTALVALLNANCSWRPRVVSAVLARNDPEIWTLMSMTHPVKRSDQADLSGFVGRAELFVGRAELRPRVYDLLNQLVGSKATVSKGPSAWDRVQGWVRRGA